MSAARTAPRSAARLDEGGVPLFLASSHALPLVSVLVAFRAGAVEDPAGRDGVTRVMARMLRRGAGAMSAAQIEERIDTLGAELGADVSPCLVTLHGDVIARNVDAFVDRLATLLASPPFDEGELGRLLRETEGEIVEARDSDRSLASRHFRRALFGGHPYGRRIGGTIPALRAIVRADVEAAYRRTVRRGNLVVALAGDVDEAHARRIAARLSAAVPDAPPMLSDVSPPPVPKGRRLVFVDKPERTQTQILIGHPALHPREDDFVPLQVATTVFGGTFTSRLMREVRSKRGWSYGAYARLAYERQPDAFTLWTFPAAKDAAACLALELELLAAFREGGLIARELSFAQRYLVRSHAFDIDTPQKRLHQRLDVDLYDLPAGWDVDWTSRVQAVTLDATRGAIERRITPDDLLVAVVGTHAEIGEAVAAAIPGLATTEVVPFDAE